MKVNVGTVGHIDHSSLASAVIDASSHAKIAARKKKNLLREYARRQKRLDKINQNK